MVPKDFGLIYNVLIFLKGECFHVLLWDFKIIILLRISLGRKLKKPVTLAVSLEGRWVLGYRGGRQTSPFCTL